MKISVAMRTFGGGKYVEQQIRSIKSTTMNCILKTIKNTSHGEICKNIEPYQVKGGKVTLYKWLLKAQANCLILKKIFFIKTNILRMLIKLRDKILS